MKPLVSIAALLIMSTLLASPPEWGTDLSKALAQAKSEHKLAFVLLGRESCGNCQATKELINGGKVPVSPEKFVIAEVNTDDPKADEAFLSKFGRDNFGDTLPFVAITDSNGKPLALYSGYKDKAALTKLINGAMAKAEGAKP